MTLLEQFREFLIAFHGRYPGGTARSLEALRTGNGKSSYRVLGEAALEGSSDRPNVIELGCGDGVLLAELALLRPQARLAGIDLTASDVALARERVPEATLITGDFASYPFECEAYDIAVSHLVFMLSGMMEPVLDKVRGMLVPGGALAFVVDDLSAPPTLYVDLIKTAMNAAGVESATTPFRPLVDHRLYNEDAMRDLLQAHGFQLERYVPHELSGDLPPPALWEMLSRMYQIGTLDDAQREVAKRAVEQFVDDRPSHVVLPFRLVVARRT